MKDGEGNWPGLASSSPWPIERKTCNMSALSSGGMFFSMTLRSGRGQRGVGASLRNKFNDPRRDQRTPDIVLKVNTGVIFTGGSKIAEHGGLNEDDVHVALLISLPGIKHETVKTPVTNQQVAPTIVKALGFDPGQLQAVQREHIRVLPFLFPDSDKD